MNAERYARLMALFDQAAELPASEHARFIAEHCQDDPEIAQRLASLLAHDANPNNALDGITPDSVSQVLREAVPGAMLEGQVIGAYRIERLLGSGGMGRVYLANRLDTDIEHAVAIKFVRPDRLEPNVLARFSRERRVLASLQHPGICTFIDTGALPDGSPFVVMEYVEGEPLLEYCNRRMLGITERLHLLRKILDAVAHAHARLVVHRDIKASNVLVTGDGQIKLLDFGIAKTLDDPDYGLTVTSERFLTPINAAPELLHGEPTGISCDIYAIGALAYELLAGRPPLKFDGLRGAQVEHMILTMPPPAMSQDVASDGHAARERGMDNPRALSRRLKGDLDAIVLRCLRKSPGDRYASVSELDADIRRHLEQVPIRARHGDRVYRLSRFVARHRLAVTMSLALLGFLLASTLILALQSAELARQRNLALSERDHAQQVVQVLRDAFQYADPARAAGDEVSARDILDAARPRLDGLVDAQPHLFALLAETLAGVELALASDAQAAELALRGLAAAEASGADPALIRSLRLTAAQGLTGQGDLDRAEALLDTVREGDDSAQPDWAMARARLALNRSGEFDLAIDLLREAVAFLDRQPVPGDMETSVRWQLAQALQLTGHTDEAIEVLDAILAWQQDRLPENHPHLALTRLRRLDLISSQDASQRTLTELREVVSQVLDQYGSDSSVAGIAHSTLATAFRRAGENDAAIAEHRRAWSAWRNALGEGHANSLRAGLNLARTLSNDPAHLAEAASILHDVLDQSEQRFGPASWIATHARLTLTRVLGALDRWEETLSLWASDTIGTVTRAVPIHSKQAQVDAIQRALTEAGCDTPTAPPELRANCTSAEVLLRRLQDAEAAE